ncbi:MAG: hypothetical protein DME18_04235, partial [Verrucomicrobia bacterium]
MVLQSRLSSRVGTMAGTAFAPQAKRSNVGPQEQRTNGAVPARQLPETTTGVQEANTLYRANEELKKRLQDISAEAATLPQTLEKNQKEREESTARASSEAMELDRLRTALEQERQQRQRLERKLQEMAVPQPVAPGDQRFDPRPGRLTAPAKAVTAARESDSALFRSNEELNKQIQAVSAEAATLRQTLEKNQKEREELTARASSAGMELDRLRTALEQECQQRQRLERKLQEMAVPQPVAPGDQRFDPRPERLTAPAKAVTAVRESDSALFRSNEELNKQLQAVSAEAATLRQALEKKQNEREELAGRIFSGGMELDQVRSALQQARQQRQQLEMKLQQMTAHQAELEKPAAERDHLESDVGEQLIAAKAAAEQAQTACQEEARRSRRFEEELASLQKQRDELSGQLVMAQQAAAETQQHSTGLETRLSETSEGLERARIELEQERQQRQQLETNLKEMTANQSELQKLAAEREQMETGSREQWNATEAARREECRRSIRFEEEMAGLQKHRDELSSQLALAQQAAEESKQRKEELENRLRESAGETERAKAEQGRLESELGGQLKAAKSAAEKA